MGFDQGTHRLHSHVESLPTSEILREVSAVRPEKNWGNGGKPWSELTFLVGRLPRGSWRGRLTADHSDRDFHRRVEQQAPALAAM